MGLRPLSIFYSVRAEIDCPHLSDDWQRPRQAVIGMHMLILQRMYYEIKN